MSCIEYPERYASAVKRNILNNALKTWRASNERHKEIESAIQGGRLYNDNSQVSGYTEDFVGSMAQALDTWGKLTPKQCEAILKGIDARAARRAEWADKQAALNAQRQHLGVVGEKLTVTITVRHIVELENAFGFNYVHICEDGEQNVIIYKGKADFPSKGETATIIATVKDHGIREGVKQTVIQRPKRVN